MLSVFIFLTTALILGNIWLLRINWRKWRALQALEHDLSVAGTATVWCHTKVLEGWRPWQTYPPPAGAFVNVMRPEWQDAVHPLRVGEDRPALDANGLWWRPARAGEGEWRSPPGAAPRLRADTGR
jgi:hypothetical protein